jgi:hypothetical protein
MAQSLAMENQARSRNEASIMHNLRSLKMGGGLAAQRKKSDSEEELNTQARLNIIKEKARRDSSARKTAEAFQKVAKKRSAITAVNQGVMLGLDLRGKIADGKFDSGTFYVVLFISILKDLLDVLTLGILGTVFNFFLGTVLFIIFLGKRSFFKKFIMKRYIKVWVLESIPFINIFPLFTIGTIMFKIKCDKRIRELGDQLERVDEDITEMKKRVK